MDYRVRRQNGGADRHIPYTSDIAGIGDVVAFRRSWKSDGGKAMSGANRRTEIADRSA